MLDDKPRAGRMDWDERLHMGRPKRVCTRRDRPVSRSKLPLVAARREDRSATRRMTQHRARKAGEKAPPDERRGAGGAPPPAHAVAPEAAPKTAPEAAMARAWAWVRSWAGY